MPPMRRPGTRRLIQIVTSAGWSSRSLKTVPTEWCTRLGANTATSRTRRRSPGLDRAER